MRILLISRALIIHSESSDSNSMIKSLVLNYFPFRSDLNFQEKKIKDNDEESVLTIEHDGYLFGGFNTILYIKDEQPYYTTLKHLISQTTHSSKSCITLQTSHTPINLFPLQNQIVSFKSNFKITFDDDIIILNDRGVYIFDGETINKVYDKMCLDAWLIDKDLYVINKNRFLCRIDENMDEFYITCDLDPLQNVFKLVGGFEHLCTLNTGGQVFTIGSGTKGQLGVGTVSKSFDVAQIVDYFSCVRIVDVACGGWHVIVLSDTNDIYGWGWNNCLQISIKGASIIWDPILIQIHDDSKQPIDVIKIACGSRHSAILDKTGRLWCWGQINYSLEIDQSNCTQPILFHSKNNSTTFSSLHCGRWNTIVQ